MLKKFNVNEADTHSEEAGVVDDLYSCVVHCSLSRSLLGHPQPFVHKYCIVHIVVLDLLLLLSWLQTTRRTRWKLKDTLSRIVLCRSVEIKQHTDDDDEVRKRGERLIINFIHLIYWYLILWVWADDGGGAQDTIIIHFSKVIRLSLSHSHSVEMLSLSLSSHFHSVHSAMVWWVIVHTQTDG